ncbi:cytochrome P450 1A1-like [Clavelina lepadiformis]|uniref:cytochrome P450 1A1-like n=1 Tax=Clavelina lepadiformis TaxID=159417 RepID=UPI004042102B
MPILDLFYEFVGMYKNELLIVFIVVLLTRQFIQYLYGNRPRIPGPFPWPIIGNAISLGSQPQLSLQAMSKKYGPIFLMKLGGVDVLVLSTYRSIKEALGRQKHIFSGRPQFKSFEKISQGKGIVFNSSQTQGENWKILKGHIIRLLHKFIVSNETRAMLESYVSKEAIEMVRSIDEQCAASKTGAIQPEMTVNVSIANVVCAFMFGHRYEYTNKEFQDLVSLNLQFGEVVGAGSQIDVMPWIKVFPKFKKAIKDFDFLTNRLNKWMKLRTEEHKQNYQYGNIRDVVDTFIEEGIKEPNGLMKDDIIMALTTDIFGAAQDTLSTTIQWVLIYMMYFKEHQKKIHQELDSVLAGDKLPDFSNRGDFPYLEACMHEIFRHSTFTSTTIPHVVTEATVLGGFHIPKNMMVFVNQFAANHDPEHWVRPDEFIPERFLDANGKLIRNPHDKYLLFSFGPRKCPGDELSRLLLMHFTATLLTLCEVQEDPKHPTTLEGVYNLSMRPKSLWTKLRVRKPDLLRKYTDVIKGDTKVPTVNNTRSMYDPVDVHTESTFRSPSLNNSQKPEFSDGDEETLTQLNQFFRRRKLSRSKRGQINEIIQSGISAESGPSR